MNSARRHDTTELRNQIRTEALRLFGLQGYGGTSIQQIADAVGISKQLLLYHYPSKEALKQSVVDQITDAWSNLLPRLLDAVASSGDRTEVVIDDLNGFLENHTDMARFALQQLIHDTGPLGTGVDGAVRPWMQVAADFIRLRQKEGVFQADVDADAFVVEIGTLLLGTIALLHLKGEWPPGTTPEEWRRRRLREGVRMIRASLLA